MIRQNPRFEADLENSPPVRRSDPRAAIVPVWAGISFDLDPASPSSTACWSTLAAKRFGTWQHEIRVAPSVGAAADFALEAAAVSMLEAALRRRPAKGQGPWWCPSCAASSASRGSTSVSVRASQRLTRRLRRAEAKSPRREPRICPSIDHPADGRSRSVAQARPTGHGSHGRRTAYGMLLRKPRLPRRGCRHLEGRPSLVGRTAARPSCPREHASDAARCCCLSRLPGLGRRLVPAAGLEPTTPRLQGECSTD